MSTLEDENTSLSQYADDTTANTALTKNKHTNHERIKKKADEMQDYRIVIPFVLILTRLKF